MNKYVCTILQFTPEKMRDFFSTYSQAL